MNIIKDTLPMTEYFPVNYKKTRICIHHTEGYGAQSSIDWWRTQPDRVGTAYVIDRDGTIYQAFPSKQYAYQFGLVGVKRRMEFEQSTIGIELANLGAITKLQNGKFADQYGRPYNGSVTQCKWRGHEYWEDYKPEQYKALSELLTALSVEHDIKLKATHHLEFDLSVFDKYTVITHANVRRDKTDISPAFDWGTIFDDLPF